MKCNMVLKYTIHVRTSNQRAYASLKNLSNPNICIVPKHKGSMNMHGCFLTKRNHIYENPPIWILSCIPLANSPESFFLFQEWRWDTSLVFLVRICLQNFLGASLERCKRFPCLWRMYCLFFLLVRALYIFILSILRDSSTASLIALLALLHSLSYHGLVLLFLLLFDIGKIRVDRMATRQG